MADNVTLNAGAGGAVVRSDDVAGVQIPASKIVLGADGVDDGFVSSALPLPVSAATLPLPSGAATATKQDSVIAQLNITLSALRDAITGVGAAAKTLADVVNALALVPVSDNAGSLTVDGSVSIGTALPAGTNNIGDVDVVTLPALPTGANAIGKLAANDGVDIGDVSVNNGAGVSAVNVQDGGNVLSVDDGAGSLTVDVGTALPAGDNNIGNVDVVTLPALAAGTNAIGKLAANSGVDIGDVDVLTLPARARTADSLSSAPATDAVMNNLTALTPKFATIAAASSGDNTIVAGVGGKKIRVLAAWGIANGTVNAKFQSGAAGTDLTGLHYLVANSGFVLPFNQVGWFETAVAALLNLNLSGATAVGGGIVYVEV